MTTNVLIMIESDAFNILDINKSLLNINSFLKETSLYLYLPFLKSAVYGNEFIILAALVFLSYVMWAIILKGIHYL